jgi:hypothetical protein
MLHGLGLAVCLIAALALFAGAIRVLLANLGSASGFGHAVQRPIEQYLGANRLAMDIMFGTADTPRAAQEGWSLIDRSSRARRAVRLAVR